MTRREFLAVLERRAAVTGLVISGELGDRLAVYFHTLALWNRKMNLTGFSLDSPTEAAIDRIFLEPLLAARAVQRPVEAMLDIGSGGGSPAIPMSLALFPNRTVLVEARVRKAIFLREVARALGLSEHLEVLNTRFEEPASSAQFLGKFDLVTVRAVRIGPKELPVIASFLKPGGQLVLFTVGDGNRVPRTPEFRLVEHFFLGTTAHGGAAVFERA